MTATTGMTTKPHLITVSIFGGMIVSKVAANATEVDGHCLRDNVRDGQQSLQKPNRDSHGWLSLDDEGDEDSEQRPGNGHEIRVIRGLAALSRGEKKKKTLLEAFVLVVAGCWLFFVH
ncbi:hypothetical protein BDY19DRAFT_1046494 [Irpex rosettiformis]|uniref:Uncharacterized protein n=1 Tax=Irpex rosettiformis TaxID=378272 RepID=A0ACB8UBE6_9APHY|nr:hypothetical protein BDY19DRAFT_1046494 [Irpex rosettiformis]